MQDQSAVKTENAELHAQMEELQLQVVMSKRALESEIHAKEAQEEILDSLRSKNQTMSNELDDKKLIEDRLCKELDDLR